MIRLAPPALALALTLSCAVPPVNTAEYEDQIQMAQHMSCPELRASYETNQMEMASTNAEKNNPTHSFAWGGMIGVTNSRRLREHSSYQRRLAITLRTEWGKRCEKDVAKDALQDQRLNHIDEKLSIERDERRHGETIDAIRDRD